MARKEAATAETALSEAAEDFAVRFANEEASKAAELVPIMREMVHAIRKCNMKEVLAVSRRAEALLAEQERMNATSYGYVIDYEVWVATDDEDMQAEERLRAPRQQRGRSRTPPPRAASLAEPADTPKEQAPFVLGR